MHEHFSPLNSQMDMRFEDPDFMIELPTDGDNSMVEFTDLFLNEEATDPSSIAERDRVEERIRQLQGVTARAGQGRRQRQRCERNPVGIRVVFGDILVNSDAEGGIADEIEDTTAAVEAKRVSGCKRDSSHLVGKALALALAMDSPAKKGEKEGGSFYDCNICLDLAADPVLTCCGHLFCWGCYFQVGYVDSSAKECPVCKGEVSDGNVVPIYGNGGGERWRGTVVSGMKLPPRPKARRVERVRKPD